MRVSLGRYLVPLALAVMLVGSGLFAVLERSVNAATADMTMTASKTAKGGASISIGIRLKKVAPAGGARIFLDSDSEAVTLPASVLVPAGSYSVSFKGSTSPVSTDTPVTVEATYGSFDVYKTVLVLAPDVSSISMVSSVKPNATVGIRVYITSAAPTGGIVVGLNSNRPSKLPVPETVTILGGTKSTLLTVQSVVSSIDVTVNVTATYQGVSVSKTTILKAKPVATATPTMTATQVPATATPVPPTATEVPPTETATEVPPTATATEAATQVTISATGPLEVEYDETYYFNVCYTGDVTQGPVTILLSHYAEYPGVVFQTSTSFTVPAEATEGERCQLAGIGAHGFTRLVLIARHHEMADWVQSAELMVYSQPTEEA